MIRFETDAAACESLWNQFSPQERAWDDWDLMYAFHDQATYKLNFLVHETAGQPDGLIPLVLDTTDNSYELFGGCYPDSRVLWIDYEQFPECYTALPENTVFFDLRGEWVDRLLARFPEYEPNFVEKDDQFYLVPSQFDYDFNNHINGFSNDKRRGFMRDLRKIREKDHRLEWTNTDESEFLFRMTIKNFGADSDHNTEGGKAEVRRVVAELQEMGLLRTLIIYVDGEKQGVSMSALYKNLWVTLYAGSNNDYDNLGKLLNVETIQEACRLRVDEINYMTGMAWKAAWKMNRQICRTMRKPARPSPQAT